MPKFFTKDHEWIETEGQFATVGITEYAQAQLGDVVFVDLPEVGREMEQGGEAAVVESVKAASEVYAPVSGRVTEVNAQLSENPALVNEAAESSGWFMKIALKDKMQLNDLMDEAAYKAFVDTL